MQLKFDQFELKSKKIKNKKSEVLEKLYKSCLKKNNFEFDNDMVNQVCKKIKFRNQFDVTKIDSISKLPNILKENDIAVIHSGSGKHKFIKGINKVYHKFEPIQNTVEWIYKKSLLNNYNTSESNLLSVTNNQRILHNFLFNKDNEFDDEDILKRPKTYFPHRTKTSFDYSFGDDLKVSLKNIQIEVDLTIEFEGNIGVFEGKNGSPKTFSIYQLYHPFLYYYNANYKSDIKGKIKSINCVYVTRDIKNNPNNIKLWAYTFDKPYDITSIKFIKSSAYSLINKN